MRMAGRTRSGDQKCRSEIDAEDALPVVEGDFGDWFGLGDASVVDQDFDFAEVAFGF